MRLPSLKIAMVAPPWFELPPAGYGGIESVVADLVNQLSAAGHHVTLIAAGRHKTAAAAFHTLYDTPPTSLLGTPMPEVIHAAFAAEVIADLDVDVVHDHCLAGPLLARGREVPTVVTMHGPVVGDCARYMQLLGPTIGLVAISDAQRRLAPGLPWVGRVHNAIAVDSYPFREAKDEHVLWIGRFNNEKAPHLAIDAARRQGRRIVLAGKLNEAEERRYFEAEISPRLGPDVDYVGEADARLKRELFAAARCLVLPLQWEEPFGIVMAEALATGTPVVAMRRGAAPEVVGDGVGGFLVDTFDEFCAAIDKAADIDPHVCRERARDLFDLPVMAAGYERVYREALAARLPATPPVRSSASVRTRPGARPVAGSRAG
jgi:glycosyltransferase involved in cell wall biosynthesis